MPNAKAEYPKVTIAIPNLNGAEHIAACLDSLRKLDYPAKAVETIVIDNGSTDDSVALLKRDYPEVKVIKNKKNTGFAVASNQGAKAGTGEFVAFLNNDMKVDSRWLLELVAAIDTDKSVICAGSKILNWKGDAIDFAGAALNFYGHGFQEGYQSDDITAFDEPRPLLFACGGAMLIDRKIFLDVGGFDEDYFAFFEDVDLGWRLWLFGYSVMFEPASITYHHHHGTASAFPFEQVYVLWERNAAYTWYKNYNQKNLETIFPAALLLAVERSLVYTGVDRSAYILEGQKTEPAETAAPGEEPSLTARLSRSLKDEGVFGTLKKITAAAKRKTAGSSEIPADQTTVSKLGLGTLVALDEFVVNLPALDEKRRSVQARRKREDAEIFTLFGDPFQSSCKDARYMRLKGDLVKLFGVDRVFLRR